MIATRAARAARVAAGNATGLERQVVQTEYDRGAEQSRDQSTVVRLILPETVVWSTLCR